MTKYLANSIKPQSCLPLPGASNNKANGCSGHWKQRWL